MCNFYFSFGIICCLASTTGTLDFFLALTLTFFWYLALIIMALSLSLAGILRFKSLWNNSVDQGIQIFGPDTCAILIVRFITILIDIVFVFSVVFFKQTFPGRFFILCNEQSMSAMDIIRNNPFILIYVLPPGFATAINILCKWYAAYLSAKLDEGNSKSKFDFSLGGSILISIQVFAIFLTSFFRCYYQLRVVFPCSATAYSLSLPLYIIFSNDKMKRHFKKAMSNRNLLVWLAFYS